MQVVDSAVLKFANAVTHFSPGSHASMPEQTTSFPNIMLAGDCVKNVPHGANGLSQVRKRAVVRPGTDLAGVMQMVLVQERAYVTGLRAANLVIRQLGFGTEAEILQVRPFCPVRPVHHAQQPVPSDGVCAG